MISPLPPQKTGESVYTANLIGKLALQKKFKIYAITGKDAEDLPELNGRVDTVKIWNGQNRVYPLTLFREIKKINPHIVHVQFGPHGEVYGGFFGEQMLLLLLLLRFAGLKTTITSHSTWMINQVVNRVKEYRILKHFAVFAPAAFRLYMKVMNWATNIIQLSTVKINSSLKKRFQEDYEIDDSKLAEIPHPCGKIEVEIDSENALNALKLVDKKIVLCFGFIREGKGLFLAIDAFSRVIKSIPDAVLMIAGSPQDNAGKHYLDELRKYCKEKGLEANVRFDSRFIPEEIAHLYFSAATIILVPYTESVGASGPIHNYAGYGTPIVASDVGYHMKEALGGTLTLFRNGDAGDLSDKIALLLKDDELRMQLVDRQRTYAEKETWETAGKRTVQYYKDIILRK
jgi:glycosyltransferase involved in cell wall biosynthesis